MDIVQLFAKAREIRDRAKIVDQKIKELFEVISPTNYPPFVEFDEFTGFVQGVRATHQGIGDDFAWYFWEIKIDGVTEWEYTLADGRTWKIKDDETFLEYLRDVYCLKM